MDKSTVCPLCGNPAKPFYKLEFCLCSCCKGIFKPVYLWLTPDKEKARYEAHQNDVTDPGYRQFVTPITHAVQRDFRPHHNGLDFGAGTGSAVSDILAGKGYDITQYDPFFHHHPDLLNRQYDYVVCCEVIEHFKNPSAEFRLLKSLLRPGGSLYCMTNLYDAHIDFAGWYYKNDSTHIFIYQLETLNWIKINCSFDHLTVEDRLIIFRN